MPLSKFLPCSGLGAPPHQEGVVSAARLRSEVPVFRVAAASFRHPGLPGHGVPRRAAWTQDGIPASTRPALRLFTSLGPTSAATGTPRERGAIEQAACQSSGTFPGVGRPGPQHFLVPTQSREPVECCGARAWPGLLSSFPDPRLDAESGELCAPRVPPSGKPARPKRGWSGRKGVLDPAVQSFGSDWAWGGRSGPARWPGVQGSWAPACEVAGRGEPAGAAGVGLRGESLPGAEGGCACALRE